MSSRVRFTRIFHGNPLVTKKKAQEAARITNAHDFITRLPQGYETVMLERGRIYRMDKDSF